jgi:hypothetical protein
VCAGSDDPPRGFNRHKMDAERKATEKVGKSLK